MVGLGHSDAPTHPLLSPTPHPLNATQVGLRRSDGPAVADDAAGAPFPRLDAPLSADPGTPTLPG